MNVVVPIQSVNEPSAVLPPNANQPHGNPNTVHAERSALPRNADPASLTLATCGWCSMCRLFPMPPSLRDQSWWAVKPNLARRVWRPPLTRQIQPPTDSAPRMQTSDASGRLPLSTPPPLGAAQRLTLYIRPPPSTPVLRTAPLSAFAGAGHLPRPAQAFTLPPIPPHPPWRTRKTPAPFLPRPLLPRPFSRAGRALAAAFASRGDRAPRARAIVRSKAPQTAALALLRVTQTWRPPPRWIWTRAWSSRSRPLARPAR